MDMIDFIWNLFKLIIKQIVKIILILNEILLIMVFKSKKYFSKKKKSIKYYAFPTKKNMRPYFFNILEVGDCLFLLNILFHS
jgi:hypothetical protein